MRLCVKNKNSGIALVITLILLSVTLVMAVAFLFVSQREQGSVTTQTDSTTARYASDAALANAEAQIAANMFASSPPNPYNFGLLVSTNYINYLGFNPGVSNPTNVNYDYLVNNGGTLSQNDLLQNVANLLYNPRAPVLVGANEPSLAGRFYLDLNRNGRYDTNGVSADVDASGVFLDNSFKTGDPEWIGILEHPNQPHGPNNHFIARYAFFAMPVGNSLDLNAIHNQTLIPALNYSRSPMNHSDDGFFRNQGVGTWELNLAAFLADLNTNQWDSVPNDYQYNRPASANMGYAFEDAFSLLTNRYAGDYNNQQAATNIFGIVNAQAVFPYDNIDAYSDGQLQTTLNTNADFTADNPDLPWAGADNTNHFFNLSSDLFDPTKSSVNFTNHLSSAGTGVSTYDRYTFYRLLSQLGTDSQPESDKMNLNYDNLDVDPATGTASETNFMAWTPLGFFTNAADRMLRDYTTEWFKSNPSNYLATYYGIHTNYNDPTAYGLTNIPIFGMTNQIPAIGVGNVPVLVNGQFVYTPAINRLLQLAANIYDATTTNFYPSRFRPIFRNDGTNIFIVSYDQQINLIIRSPTNGEYLNPDLAAPIDVSTLLSLPANTDIHTNVYGIPWIIGAKKGLPNFNEYSLESAFQITRKLQFTRNTNTWEYASNQMYIMNISNYFGVECWNSYSNNYPKIGTGLIDIMVRDNMAMTLTNDAAGFSSLYNNNPTYANFPQPYTVLSWQAYGKTNSFLVPLNMSIQFLTNSIYNYGNTTYPQTGFIPIGPDPITGLPPQNYQDKGTPPLPHFGLLMTNRLQVAIVDYSAGVSAGQIIDYVQLDVSASPRDLNSEIADSDSDAGMWSTNLVSNGAPYGVIYQETYSRHGAPALPPVDGDGSWVADPNAPVGFPATPAAEQFYFNQFFAHSLTATYRTNNRAYPITYTFTNAQAPYTITRTRVQRISWQANDPLVHYLANDLAYTFGDTNIQNTVGWPDNLGLLNERYMPWGGNPNNPPNPSTPDDPKTINQYNITLKDPLLKSSDNWDFPTNKLPTVGWLGRVHRGTPWQTVYLKASDILTETNTSGANIGVNTWASWTGNGVLFDLTNTAPKEDHVLFDIFTTAFDDNTTRGQLSVNVGANDSGNPQAGLAAWSALFSGVVAPPNNPTNLYTTIDPAGVASVASNLGSLVTNINYTRSNFKNSDGLVGTFEHKGDILAAPQLTEQSPFLDLAQTNYNNDEMYEWLPQQVMSLLRVSSAPRYVIYSYGQSLKPAPGGVYLNGGNYFGMVTNYQVTGETATRVVVRIEGAPTNTHAVIENFNILPPD